jgi:capsular polysaccharide biosynthesis protein
MVQAATQIGWRLSPSRRAFLRDLAAACSGRDRPPVVAVLGPPGGSDIAGIVSLARPRARVSLLDATAEPSVLHATLAAAGPLDVVVDASGRGLGRADLFRRVFHHLRPGGSYLVWNTGLGPREGGVLALVLGLAQLRARGRGRPRGVEEEDEAALAEAVERTTIEGRHLVVTSRSRALAKLTEEETDLVLAARGPATGRVLHRLEPVRFASRCTVTDVPAVDVASSPRVYRRPGHFDVPAMSLREYTDAVCLPGQVAVSGNLMLVDTFRHSRRVRMVNRCTHDVAPRFAEPAQSTDDLPALDGACFFLDSEFRGHYGHAMTEQLARLWAWPLAKQAEPGLRALVAVNKWGPQLRDFERALYAAAGIAPEDVLLVDGPVRVERLLTATPMFSQPDYAHPDLRDTYDTVSRALAEQAPERDYPRRIFCARRSNHRDCRNAEEVEDLFARHGFEVVFPERFTLPEQARMFREAEVIAGYSGSVMVSLCLTGGPKRVILVSSSSYSAKNEYLIGSVLGHHIDIVWCAAETPMPADRHLRRAFVSPFTMDTEREGRQLVEILASLTGSEIRA